MGALDHADGSADGFGTDGLVWERRPRLTRPLMVCAFAGWNDAGDAATGATRWLAREFDARPFASVDPETHLDYRRHRPRLHLVDGVTSDIDWPANRFLAGPTGGPHDAVLLMGMEPSRNWRSFCRAVLEVVATTGCEMVVMLGALLADVPHTRPPVLTGSATDPALIDELRREGEEWRLRIDDAVGDDDDTRAYIRRLEERADHPSAETGSNAGDDIAAAFERYLREQDAGGEGRDEGDG